jgi:23S rRNA (guanosine2251-2'-O)-methyltransferase
MTDGLSYVGGVHSVKALLKSDAAGIKQLYVSQGRRDSRLRAIFELARLAGVGVTTIARAELEQLAGSKEHQGLLAAYRGKAPASERELMPYLSARTAPLLILVLDEVQDPHNLGACLRSADAAGVDAVITPVDNSVGVTPVVRKVASGAAESMALFQVINLQRALKLLQASGIWVFGAAGEADSCLYDMDFSGSVAIVMGAEGSGMRRLTRENCDGLFKIPMLGTVSSLNVSVATGVALFEVCRQRQLIALEDIELP